MIRLARAAEGHLRAVYKPDGLNLGINIGRSAGRELRTPASARAAEVDGRHQFHDGDGGDAGAAGRSRGDVGEDAEGVGGVSRGAGLVRH